MADNKKNQNSSQRPWRSQQPCSMDENPTATILCRSNLYYSLETMTSEGIGSGGSVEVESHPTTCFPQIGKTAFRGTSTTVRTSNSIPFAIIVLATIILDYTRRIYMWEAVSIAYGGRHGRCSLCLVRLFWCSFDSAVHEKAWSRIPSGRRRLTSRGEVKTPPKIRVGFQDSILTKNLPPRNNV